MQCGTTLTYFSRILGLAVKSRWRRASKRSVLLSGSKKRAMLVRAHMPACSFLCLSSRLIEEKEANFTRPSQQLYQPLKSSAPIFIGCAYH